MKKILLSLALVAFGLTSANAEQYTIFSADNYGSWAFEGGNDGYTATLNVGGKDFTITTAKNESSTDSKKPTDQIRVYKSSNITISAKDFNFKYVVITATETKYGNAQTVEGWTQDWNADALTLSLSSETAANSVTMTASANQFRIVKIVVSDTEITTPPAPKPETVKVSSVKEAISQADNTNVTVDFKLTVGFVNRSNIFAVDAAGDFIQIYGSNSYKTGDVIPAGWEAKYTLYSGATPELMPNGKLPEASEGTFEPKEVAAADITTALVNSVVLVKNVVFDAATPAAKENFNGKVGDKQLSFRNNYTLPSVEAGTYDVTIVVTVYKGEPSLYVVNYTPSSSSSISDIAIDGNAPVEYFNLQGIRVDNPENGLFIRRQGNKVTKVLVK